MALRTQWRPGDAFLIRHKDANLVVVEKKAGMLTHAGPGQDERNLLDSLRDFLQDRSGHRHLKALHRLDRVVSGLLVFSRSERVFQALKAQFVERSIQRSYLAMVQGEPPEAAQLAHHLDADPLTVKVVSEEHPNARKAVLNYKRVEVFKPGNASLLEVKLETGLRNQIRVQFAAIGHPLLGEKKYPAGSSQGQHRIFLHAAKLSFVHPISKQILSFEAQLPPDLRRWKAALQKRACPTCPKPPLKKSDKSRRSFSKRR